MNKTLSFRACNSLAEISANPVGDCEQQKLYNRRYRISFANHLFSLKHIFALLCLMAFGEVTFAQDVNTLRAKHFNTEHSIAIQGYDPVSYFSEGKGKKGNSKFAFSYGNIVYYFSSQANLDLFRLNPARYEPQYGGWCAFAMGNAGEKVEVDPKTFKLIDHKLYLFYNSLFNNTLKTWNTREEILLPQANKNWKITFK